MKPFSIAISSFALVAMLVPASASAQQSGAGSDLRPPLTQKEFTTFTAELGSILRFRQLGDTTTVGKGQVDISVQFANNTTSHPTADLHLGRSISSPRIVARFGVNDRVDVGAWGGFEPNANYGLAGVDTKIVLLREGPGRPVSVSLRPSVTSLIGPADVWAANASIDVSVSRAMGPVSPYAGVATSGSLAIERSADVDLDPATVEGSLSYAGLSYRWRAIVLSAEVEKGTRVSYGFRLGTRF